MTMTRVEALEQLGDYSYSGRLDADGLYKLLRRAGYSDDVSQKVASQRGWDRLIRGEKV